MTTRRRFYKNVSITPQLGIALDGKPVRTPGKSLLILPTTSLAEAVAAEWEAQVETIKPQSMPLTKLSNTAIDRVAPERKRILDEIIEYAGSDLVCYRAESPLPLVERQAALWNPMIGWAQEELGISFRSFPGVLHQPQPGDALIRLGRVVASLNDFALTALHNIMTLTGSALLSLMLARGKISPEAAWQAAHVDEDFQIEQWGEDWEASERREQRLKEFEACCRFLKLTTP